MAHRRTSCVLRGESDSHESPRKNRRRTGSDVWNPYTTSLFGAT